MKKTSVTAGPNKGWVVEVRERKGGNSAGQTDTYYRSPNGRSLPHERARPRSTAGRRLEQRVQLRVTAFGDIALLYIVIFVLSFPFFLVVS